MPIALRVSNFWRTMQNLTLETFSNHRTICWQIYNIALFASFMIYFQSNKHLGQYVAAAKGKHHTTRNRKHLELPFARMDETLLLLLLVYFRHKRQAWTAWSNVNSNQQTHTHKKKEKRLCNRTRRKKALRQSLTDAKVARAGQKKEQKTTSLNEFNNRRYKSRTFWRICGSN